MDKSELMTFGGQRKMILETIMGLRNGSMDVGRGMAIAANMKVLNDSIQTEINVVKISMMARKEGHNFGEIVGMGQKLIGN